ncbi:MAG TPA: AraC family transcriptional regulator, partial [Chitinophagaceae bacterium]|nr:AraC family transcriptional regulator [Chitinophagaceae bacterium]
HTEVREAYRPDVQGPISLFLNLKGRSFCTTDNRKVQIPEHSFFLTNLHQEYTLEVESSSPVETFNIHIGEYLSGQALSSLRTPAETALLNGMDQPAVPFRFHNQLYRKDAVFHQIILRFRQMHEEGVDRMRFEEQMVVLLNYLVLQQREVMQQIRRLPAVKASTREELYRRLAAARDCLQARLQEPVTLDELAEAACLSKFHFLRLFRQTFGLSPYQYLQQLRLEEAKTLLRQSGIPVHQIADRLGFENANSFSRLFYRRERIYPTDYRAAAN